MPQNENTLYDKSANKSRCDMLLQSYRNRQNESGTEFDRVVKTRAERAPPSTDPEETDEVREELDAVGLVYKPPKRLRAGAEVRGQSSVAMCVVPNEFGECLFKILGCFESTTDADSWVRNVGSRYVLDDDIFVSPTCDWIYPNGKSKNGKAYYRNDELQRIMDAAQRNPEMVRSYKDWKAEQDSISVEVDKGLLEEGVVDKDE